MDTDMGHPCPRKPCPPVPTEPQTPPREKLRLAFIALQANDVSFSGEGWSLYGFRCVAPCPLGLCGDAPTRTPKRPSYAPLPFAWPCLAVSGESQHNLGRKRTTLDYSLRTREQQAYVNDMQRSLFCLTPSGHTCETRRFYDAIASGCIPITVDCENNTCEPPRRATTEAISVHILEATLAVPVFATHAEARSIQPLHPTDPSTHPCHPPT